MRNILLLTFAALFFGVAHATTLEVALVYQPISLHGTDVDAEIDGKHLQANLFSRPFVLSGAMPEALVVAIGSPHKMSGPPGYEVKECNLLILYGMKIDSAMEDSELVVSINLSKLKAPDEVGLSPSQVLKLSIKALKKSLKEYHHPENDPLKVRVMIEGLNERNLSLKKLSEKFTIGE